MWNEFQKILEKRVVRKNKIKSDKYLVVKVCQDFLVRFFGEMGVNKIKISDYKAGVLWITCENSIWRNEIKLNEKEIIEKINQINQEELIEKIILN
jgi:hypothetical protein